MTRARTPASSAISCSNASSGQVATLAQWRIDVPIFTGSEKRQLKAERAALITCIAVLVALGRVAPPLCRQQCRNSGVVFQPHGDVEVVVGPRRRPTVEVDRPAAEQPIRESLAVEQLMNPSQRSQLLRCVHAVRFATRCHGRFTR
jgi:hypothetical protein